MLGRIESVPPHQIAAMSSLPIFLPLARAPADALPLRLRHG